MASDLRPDYASPGFQPGLVSLAAYIASPRKIPESHRKKKEKTRSRLTRSFSYTSECFSQMVGAWRETVRLWRTRRRSSAGKKSTARNKHHLVDWEPTLEPGKALPKALICKFCVCHPLLYMLHGAWRIQRSQSVWLRRTVIIKAMKRFEIRKKETLTAFKSQRDRTALGCKPYRNRKPAWVFAP